MQFIGNIEINRNEGISIARLDEEFPHTKPDTPPNSVKVKNQYRRFVQKYESESRELLVFGNPYYEDEPLDSALENRGVADIEHRLDQLYGHFFLLINDVENGEIILCSDRASALSCYVHRNAGSVFITSNILGLKGLMNGEMPQIRRNAVFEYLATGHLWGRGTFWEKVTRLGPADRVTVSEAGSTVEKYWQFDFDDAEGASTDALIDAIERDIEQLPAGKGVLTLSGGYDSRALLGFMTESSREFDVISYNFGDEYEGDSDADVAQAYASKASQDIDIIEAEWDPESLVENIDYGIQITGGESDVALSQDAFLGQKFFQSLAEEYDYVLRGDEVWGFGDLAIDRNTAYWRSLMFSIDQIPATDQILTESTYKYGVNYVDRFRAGVDDRVPKTVSSSNELKDFVYWNHREGRLIQDIATYRRHHLPQYAPFIFGRSFEVVNRSKDSQRVNKQLFIKSMRERFPALFEDDVEVTSKRPITSRFELLFADEDFQAHIRDCLLENPHPVVQDIFDMEGLEAYVEDVLSRSIDRNTTKKSQYNLLRRVYELSQRSNRLNAFLTYLYGNALDQDFPVMDTNFLFRIYCMNRSLKAYSEKSTQKKV